MTLPSDAITGGLAFHRLIFARRRSGWWTPLLTGLLALVFYVVFLVVVIVITVIASFADASILERMQTMATDRTIDLTDPLMVTYTLGSIALMLPSYLLASLVVNGRRVGLISSAAGRLRWRWMLLCTAIGLAVVFVVSMLSTLVPTGPSATPPSENPLWPVSLVVLILLVPVQSAAEEYLFRGYLMQAIGRWLRHPAFAILLPVPLFVLGHMYDIYGQIAVGAFAVAAGWLTWRTGGLEAAIGLHVANNLVGFLFSLAGAADASATEQSVASLVASLALITAYAAVIELLYRRSRLPRTLVLTLPAAPDAAQAARLSASRIV